LHKSYAIAIAMAAVTFQYGGYFGFKLKWFYPKTTSV
jgi:hypothetical protein